MPFLKLEYQRHTLIGTMEQYIVNDDKYSGLFVVRTPSKDLTIILYLLILDVSKALVTVNRIQLFTILHSFLEDNEIHMRKIFNRKCHTEN